MNSRFSSFAYVAALLMSGVAQDAAAAGGPPKDSFGEAISPQLRRIFC